MMTYNLSSAEETADRVDVGLLDDLVPSRELAFVTEGHSTTWSDWLESVGRLADRYRSLSRARAGLLVRPTAESYATLAALSRLGCDLYLLDERSDSAGIRELAEAQALDAVIDPAGEGGMTSSIESRAPGCRRVRGGVESRSSHRGAPADPRPSVMTGGRSPSRCVGRDPGNPPDGCSPIGRISMRASRSSSTACSIRRLSYSPNRARRSIDCWTWRAGPASPRYPPRPPTGVA